MKFPSIRADEHGESHFADIDFPEHLLAAGPPPNPPGRMSDLGPATALRVIAFPAGTAAPAHNAPQPYICIVLTGEAEVEASSGEARRFRAGDLLFCDDLTGKGHVTRAITDLALAFIARPLS